MRSNSARAAIAQFSSPAAAAKYAQVRADSPSSRREARCIERMLGSLPRGSSLLVVPCGAGRHLPRLAEMGFRITAADVSPYMVAQARRSIASLSVPAETFTFTQLNVLETGFAGNAFDAVLCNRLLHHFREPETRRTALRELRRICSGPLVISFFCSLAWDAVAFRIRNALSREKAEDRIPISLRALRRGARDAGLRVSRVRAARPGISMQWYAELRRAAPRPAVSHQPRRPSAAPARR